MADTPNSLSIGEKLQPDVLSTPAPKTRGEKLFDWSVYGGVNGVANFLVTIPFAYWCLHGKGAKYFERAGKAMEKYAQPERVRETLEMLGTSLGGTAMVVPTYIAEHYRKPIVDSLNARFGNAEDQKAEIHHPPKQTVVSLLTGRATAMLTVWAAFTTAGKLFPEPFKNFRNDVAYKLCKLFKTPAVDALGKETKAFHYGQMAALDVFATTSATILLYSISRAFAKQRDTRKQHRAERAGHKGDVAVDEMAAADVVGTSAASGDQQPDTRIAGTKQHGATVAAPPFAEAVQR